MIATDKLIVCVAPCGSFLTKEANPSIPTSPEEIAEEVYRSWNEGASIAHIHARNKEGMATTDPEVFRETARLIKEKKCDIVVAFSTSPGREEGASVEDGFRVLEAGPEMVSFNVGVAVFMSAGQERIRPWTRSFDERMMKALLDKDIKPEFELHGGLGSLAVEVKYLIENFPIPKPYWIDFPLGMQRTAQNATPYTPRNMMHLVDQLPPDSMFMTLGVGADQTPAVVQSILLGGHARVGFEDNIYYSRGVLAKSNAELVTRIVRIGKDLGRTIATPDEARDLLGLKKLQVK
ncbi:MAG TPA: 3-keto-5-aminohexanoate cleavage protein [Dehalococcoidia bacterium]|nr:3-keto-5-aminohexanoate cleavage protein [Dehalococcoidia bacterium]